MDFEVETMQLPAASSKTNENRTNSVTSNGERAAINRTAILVEIMKGLLKFSKLTQFSYNFLRRKHRKAVIEA